MGKYLTTAVKCFTIAECLFRSAKIREYEVVADSQPGHIDQIKQTNAGAVYRLIDQLGPVSRIDLSRLAQLAPASITKIVREMLEAHLVQETEIQEPALPLITHQPRRNFSLPARFKQQAGGRGSS